MTSHAEQIHFVSFAAAFLDGTEKSVMPFPPILHVPTPTCVTTQQILSTDDEILLTRPVRESGTAKILRFCFPFRAPLVLEDCSNIT